MTAAGTPKPPDPVLEAARATIEAWRSTGFALSPPPGTRLRIALEALERVLESLPKGS